MRQGVHVAMQAYDLERLELPGQIRTVEVPLVRELAIPLEPSGHDSALRFNRTASGALAMQWKERPEVAFWDLKSDQMETRDLGATDASWRGIDAWGDRFAVAGVSSLRILDRRGAFVREHRFENPDPAASCRFGADGSLWLLVASGYGTARLHLFDPSFEAQGVIEISHDASGGPAHHLEDPHPTQPVIPISAGMGQDGAFYVFARILDGELSLDAPVDDVCFAGWGPRGELFATLPHYGGLLQVCHFDRSVRWKHDLDPLLEILDESDNWEAHLIDAERAVVPTSEGRLLMITMGHSEVIDLRLHRDERNWNWAHVQLGPESSLITARSQDHMIRLWDLAATLER
jgi:WD40 repeat protein